MADYSVLMSVYKKENPKYFKAAIDSMLNQTALTNDFVLVCDGPLSDGLEGVIAEFVKTAPGLFHIVRLPENRGLAKALNEGLRHCKNEIVVRMDSDDISTPNRVERQLIEMEKQGVHIVGSNIIEFTDTIENTTNVRQVPQYNDEIVKFTKKRSPFNHPSVAYKKSAVLSAGAYKDYRYFEDYHLWAEMLSMGYRGYNIQENLVYMRAGEEMYHRRGGLCYVQYIFRFENSLRKLGYIHMAEFLFSGISRAIVSLIPNSLRTTIYKKILRKK